MNGEERKDKKEKEGKEGKFGTPPLDLVASGELREALRGCLGQSVPSGSSDPVVIEAPAKALVADYRVQKGGVAKSTRGHPFKTYVLHRLVIFCSLNPPLDQQQSILDVVDALDVGIIPIVELLHRTRFGRCLRLHSTGVRYRGL